MSWHAIALAHANLRIKALERQLATLEDTLALFTDSEIQRRSFAEICESEANSNRLREPTCSKAPIGWRCTRAKGHEGPCAAVSEQATY